MAYTPVVGDILEIRVYTFDTNPPTQLGINVSHWRVQSVLGLGVTQGTIAAAFDNPVSLVYKPWLANSVAYKGVTVQKVWPRPVISLEFSAANSGAGTGGVSMMPAQVSGLIKTVTGRAGRAFRGRLYIPFPSGTYQNNAGNLNAGGFTALDAIRPLYGTAFTATSGFNQATLVPTLWHRKGYGKPPVNVGSDDLITAAISSPLLATIRRRGNYGRANQSSPI